MRTDYTHPTKTELLAIFHPLITPYKALLYRKRAQNAILSDLKERKGRMLAHLMKATTEPNKWFCRAFMSTLQTQIDKKEKSFKFMDKQLRVLREIEKAKANNTPIPKQAGLPPLDVESAKTYPIPQILENHGIQLIRNKFAIRNEKTPSCNYYANNNNYYDFGSSTGGDSIDLYMKLNGCDFVEAVKNLS